MDKTNTPNQPRLRALVSTNSYNPENRTFEVCFATSRDIPMWGWEEGSYIESLSMTGINLERYNAGAPLLNAHSSYNVNDVIGKVVPDSVRIEGEKAFCQIKLSGRESVAGIRQDIEDGILTNFSVGYTVENSKLVEKRGNTNYYIAENWTPLELSIVPIPADYEATIRELVTSKESDLKLDLPLIERQKQKIQIIKTIQK